MKPEANVERVLSYLAHEADIAMQSFAEVLKARRLTGAQSLNINAYTPVAYLHGLNRDLELPGEWPEIVDRIWNEYQYLAELYRAIQKEKLRS